MLDFSKFKEPTLLLDKKICMANIEKMVSKAARNNVRLRPHFKTHQSLAVGEWYREHGVEAITVSSVLMAKYFSESWHDITIAFPINPYEAKEIEAIASKVSLNVTAVNEEAIKSLAERISTEVGIYIKIDVGYHRTGILPQDTGEIDDILRLIDRHDHLTFKGFMAHAGHTYSLQNRDEIKKVHDTTIASMVELRRKCHDDYPDLELSIGDTPSCSLMEDFSEVDEMRPGNFVFYDLTQNSIGSCSKGQIAVCMAVPVVAKHKDRNEIIVYGGGVHFCKDSLEQNGDYYGEVVELTSSGWSAPIENVLLRKISQEHGTLQCSNEFFNQTKIGDWVGILPIHSCMTANSMGGYTTLENERLDHMNKRSFQFQ